MGERIYRAACAGCVADWHWPTPKGEHTPEGVSFLECKMELTETEALLLQMAIDHIRYTKELPYPTHATAYEVLRERLQAEMRRLSREKRSE